MLGEALESAQAGLGRAVLLVGEPGVGKTTLLEHTAASWRGSTVLRCLGVEWEAELPFAGLHSLLTPLLDDVHLLPEPQRMAVSTALGLELGSLQRPLHLLAGVLSLILERTRIEPVLLVCDDLHWLDEPTRQVLAFLAPRIIDEPVLLLGASRDSVTPDWSRGRVVDIEPLSAAEVGELAAASLGLPLPERAISDLAQAANGNPLVVLHAVDRLGDHLARRGTGLEPPLRLGDVAHQALADRMRSLDVSSVRAVELLAVTYSTEMSVVTAALSNLGVPIDGLERAEQVGVVEFLEASVRFTHPLLRSLVHERAPQSHLRECHHALARVDALSPDLKAWHAACAAIGTDERTASALEASAKRFTERGGMLAAAQALRRAAELTESRPARSDRLLQAAFAAHSAGHSQWGVELARAAADVADDVVRQIRAEYRMLGMQLHTEWIETNTARIQLDLAARVRGQDLRLEADILGSVVLEATMISDRQAFETAADAIDRLDLDALSPEEREELIAAHATGLVYFGGPDAVRGRELLTESGRRRLELELPREGYVIESLLWIEEHDLAQELGRRALRRATNDGDLLTAVPVAATLGLVAYRTGDWAKAERRFELAATLVEDGEHASNRATVALLRGLLGAGQGDARRVEEAQRWAEPAERFGFSYGRVFSEAARGLLGLAELRYGAAIDSLTLARDRWREVAVPDPNPLSWPLDLVEAHVLLGDLSAAEAALADLRTMAQASLRSWLHAAVPFAEGMLADDASFEGSLLVAIEAFDGARAPFERARAQLWLGRRLQRVGRGVEARGPLEAALSEFERLGAEPWARQVQRELGTSERLPRRRRRAADDPNELTPQERQVAALVASGATNKEAAGELFLSPKTVESHLSRIYRKLNVTSRTQLAARWNDGTGPRDEG